MKASAREWIIRIALVAFVPASFFLLLELGLGLFGYGHDSSFFLQTPDGAAYATNQRYGMRYFPKAIARAPIPLRFAREADANSIRIVVLGESAAMGFPESGFGFGRLLQAMLEERYPSVGFEVINTAMTAVNSHAVLDIARQAAKFRPDFFVVYMGNNEVVGPFGPGTVFSGYVPSLPLIRAALWAKATRTGQLFSASMARLPRQSAEPREWGGMAMFLQNDVRADDPRLNAVYHNLRENLNDIIGAARSCGAKVIVSTVAVNLSDSPPFASGHHAGFAASELERWRALFNGGVQAADAGDCTSAIEKFQAASAIDDRHAELHFRLGRCHAALGRAADARQHFLLARDLDMLRFRADTGINQGIREAATGREAVYLVDAERNFQADDAADKQLFLEHVHFTFDGAFRLARLIYRELSPLLPERIRLSHRGAEPDRDIIARRLAFTPWDEFRIASDILVTVSQPPFTNQFDHRERQIRLRDRVDRSRSLAATSDNRALTLRMHREALDRFPKDLELRRKFAEWLKEEGMLRESAAEWQRLVDELPGVASWYAALGNVLSDAGDLDRANLQYKRALECEDDFAAAHVGIGVILFRQGQTDKAVEKFEEALRLNPGDAEAHNNLGLLMARSRQTDRAIHHYREALKTRPSYTEAHNNLGLVLAAAGRLEEAITHYRRALESNPKAGTHYNLAAALMAQGKMREAIREHRESLRLQPSAAGVHYGLSVALAAVGQTDEAIDHLSEAARLKKDFAQAHYNLGLLLARKGGLQQALEQYSEAIRIDPGYAEAWNNKGTALARMRQFEEAAAHFRQALKIRPDYQGARANLDAAIAKAGPAAGRRAEYANSEHTLGKER